MRAFQVIFEFDDVPQTEDKVFVANAASHDEAVSSARQRLASEHPNLVYRVCATHWIDPEPEGL